MKKYIIFIVILININCIGDFKDNKIEVQENQFLELPNLENLEKIQNKKNKKRYDLFKINGDKKNARKRD